MKLFIKKHKQLILEFVIFLVLLSILLIIMNLLKFTPGKLLNDFERQHVRFIDYLRNSFWKTHDLAPQVTLNYGGSQNMASLFYYGQYNPLIMISYLFPFINTMYWMQIMTFILISGTFLSMNVLLRRFKVDSKYVFAISVLCAFAPALAHHLSYHIMFIYYFPILILSLTALDILIKENKKWLFIICVALIFYTNFFFALVIGFIQLIFFIANLHFRYKFDLKECMKKYKILIFCYLIGTMIGMLTFLPQALAIFSGDRQGKEVLTIPLFFENGYRHLTTYSYSMGLAILPIFVIILGLVNYKNKFGLVLVSSIIITTISSHFNLLLNLGQYVHGKVYIYFIPIVFLLLGIYLSDEKTKFKRIVFLISIAIMIIIYNTPSNSFYSGALFRQATKLLIIGQVLLIGLWLTRDFKYKRIIAIPFLIICVYASLQTSLGLIGKKEFKGRVEHKNIKEKKYYVDKKEEFYRTNSAINLSTAINEYSPLSYVSVANPEYIDFYTKFLDVEKYRFSRFTKANALNNDLFSRFLGITKYKTNKKKVVINYRNVRPFIYGVTNENICDASELVKQDKFNRLLALNGNFYVGNAKKCNYKKVEVKEVYQSKERNFMMKKTTKKEIAIPKKYQKDGILIVKVKVVSKKISKTKIMVKKHESYVRPVNLYREPEQREAIFYIDMNTSTKKIKMSFNGSLINVYDQIKIDYVSKKDTDKYTMPYIATSKNITDYNKSYSFDIDMPNNGYLGTSIFYDSAFIIKVDGKKVKNEKVNNNFLGTKLLKGKHKITIGYEMPGFKVGLIVTFLGFFALAFVMISEIKFFNKPFFRFVLVGICNTVNYYIAYTILLTVLPYLFAHVLGFIISALISYFLTTIYTFQKKPCLETFCKFPLTFLPNLILSSFGTTLFVELHVFDKSIASLVMMILIIPITFLINKLIFVKKEK